MRRKRGALFVDEERFFSLTGECGSPATDMEVRTCCGQGSLRHDEDNIMFRSWIKKHKLINSFVDFRRPCSVAGVDWTTMNVIPDLKDITTSDTATDV
jgi:hypothetical protein